MNPPPPGNPYGYGYPPQAYPQQPQQQPSYGQQPYGPYPGPQPQQPYAPPYAQQQQFGYQHPYGQPQRAGAGCCEACGVAGETKHVNIMYNVGCLVVRFHKTMNAQLCKRCIGDYFWKYSLTTMFFGWWGVISFVVSLITLPMNFYYFLTSLGMHQPTDAEYAQAGANANRGMPGWQLALIVFGITFALLAILTVIGLAAG